MDISHGGGSIKRFRGGILNHPQEWWQLHLKHLQMDGHQAPWWKGKEALEHHQCPQLPILQCVIAKIVAEPKPEMRDLFQLWQCCSLTAGNSSIKDFHGSLKLPKPVYSLICQLSKLPQHVGNNLLDKGSLQPVARLIECRLKTTGAGPEVFNIDG